MWHFVYTFRSVTNPHAGILVRNDAARDKLQQKLKNSIIMSGPMFNQTGAAYLTHTNRTLYESKGLEFNDVSLTFLRIFLMSDKIKVLLYNFFGDSNATLNQWRLVLNGISEWDGLSDAPTFDETRHASICVEVRFLQPKLPLYSTHGVWVDS